MNVKIATQILMVLLIILISWLFFYKYLKQTKINTKQDVPIKSDNLLNNSSSNFIDNVNYTSSDLNGNEYKIIAEKAEIDISNPDIMFLENVTAFVYINKSLDTVKITSNFGKYNTKNYDTIFSKNVIITYPDHKITGDYLDFSLLNNLGTMSVNVVYNGDKTRLIADRIEINISTKDTKIFMNNNNNKVLIEGIK